MKFLARILLIVIAASAAVFAPVARAQTQPTAKPGTVGASAGDSFDELVDNDMAKGYYSQEQGAALKSQFDDAFGRMQASLDKATSSFTNYANLVKTSGENQKIDASIYSFVDANDNVQIGRGTPQEIQDQAETLYAMADQNFQVLATLMETLTPAVSDILNEVQQVVAARAALIQANPAVSADVKHNAQYESNKFSDYVKNDLDRGLATVSATLRADQDIVESNKTQIVQTLTKALPLFADYTEKYGPDPKKWPPPPKGYFSTSNGTIASNGPSGASNGAAGNGSGSNSGPGSSASSGSGMGSSDSSGSGTGSSDSSGSGMGSSDSSGSGTGSSDSGGSGTGSSGSGGSGTGSSGSGGSGTGSSGSGGSGTGSSGSGDANSAAGPGSAPGNGSGSGSVAGGTGGAPQNGSGTNNNVPVIIIIAEGHQLVNGPQLFNDSSLTSDTAAATATMAQLAPLLAGEPQGPYSDVSDLTGGSFTAIYNGYTVTPGQNGSTVIPVTSNQVQTPSSVMTMPSDQVQTGTNQILVPSTQVNTPSSLINMPSTQLPTPSLCGR